ncbi:MULTISPECIES: hypothetical protein [unclassified Streptomyces]|uniref:hypothetical protein n=1 Tax=unclassified Streptomyces TaxID=2593676 RepID=UPI0006AE8D9E|nr:MULTISPECIES: hypothetical protein [unclassified Streptomyces]KOU88682.1 hypothetical protein ADK93_12150 [Streptomyces sp. XY58]KOV03632.1 hypothetical protein ADK89_26205 [Streptomyces sp. XY37]KOV46797.1 hypothetical protein ADK99_21025 [Streptomyces sp. MMG1064]
MAEAVPVRCPACLRENGYTAPVFPCACGSPVHPPLDLSAPPVLLTHRTWSDSWVAVRCTTCGRESEWPHPELGCGSCGTVVRLPVHPPERPEAGTGPGAGPGAAADPAGAAGRAAGRRGDGPADARDGDPAGAPGDARAEVRGGAAAGAPGDGRTGGPGGGGPAAGPDVNPAHISLPPTAAVPRPAFRPVTIRTARDAVATAALYLRWLGFEDVRQPDGRPIPSAAVDLRAPGLVAQVDPTTAPAGLRAVECVWLNGLTASATSVYFSLAGYTADARDRADELGIPLFVMDLTGMPQPVNDPADELVGSGA